jgi:hypothetical protein
MSKTTFIYYLEKDNNIFYVGKTTDPVKRKHKHRQTYGKFVTLNVIDEVEDWKFWETYWIHQFKTWNFNLMNQNNGGGGPQSYKEEHKQKMRKPRKEGTGEKISISLKNGNHSQYYTDEIKEKISIGNKILKPFTEEHIKNLQISKRKQAKSLLQYSKEDILINEWDSKGEAAEWIKSQNLSQAKNIMGQIKDCCLGRQKTAFGYKWKYK